MRKLVILAREAGYDIEPDQVRVESLVPAHCEEGSIDHFFENGDALNEQMVQRLEAARELGLVLRYVARFDANGKARVGVEAVRPEHPLAALLPCDNVFAIESRWYRDNPLVIRGPGAGRDVTAGRFSLTSTAWRSYCNTPACRIAASPDPAAGKPGYLFILRQMRFLHWRR
ncbi:bifunctional aspartokinase II/homoserine dehydrogenase II [Salmonella enterica subsp. enterica]|nr:bifunctional aspartokinase II/homoserine dehydrogenase II [Salmonella enterica subsp. enterica]